MSTYNEIKADRNSFVTSSYLRANGITVTEKDLAQLGKMGFSTLSEGSAFNNELKTHSAPLKSFFANIGNAAVPMANGQPRMANGQPVRTALDPVLSAFGNKFRSDPNILDKLDRDFQQNPAIRGRLMQAIQTKPAEAARLISQYNGQDGGPGGKNGQLERLVNQIVPAPAAKPAPPRTAATQAAPTKPASTPEHTARPARAAVPADAESTTPVAAAPSQATVSPVAVAAAATAPAAGDASAEPRAQMTAKDVEAMADQLADKFTAIAPDLNTDGKIDAFRSKLKTDKTLQEQIATNFNNNPEFVDQMMKLAAPSADGKESASDKLLKQYGRSTVSELINDPSLLAKDSYVDGLSGKLGMANSGFGDFGKMLGPIWDSIKSFCGPLFQKIAAACSELFSGGNFLSMKNGASDLFNRFTQGINDMAGTPSNDNEASITHVEPKTGQVSGNDPHTPPKPEEPARVATPGSPAASVTNPAGTPAPAGGNPVPPTASVIGS